MSSGKKKGAWSKGLRGAKSRRVTSWADWAARRPLGIELPKRPARVKPGRIGPSLGGSGSPSPAAKAARCSACPRGGCPNCPARRR